MLPIFSQMRYSAAVHISNKKFQLRGVSIENHIFDVVEVMKHMFLV